MITERDLMESIAECQGIRKPTANTCIKLASFYTILDHMKAESEEPQDSYSYASKPYEKDVVTYQGDSDFAKAIYGMDVDEILDIVDELMSTLSVVNPQLYRSVMRRVT